MPADPRVLTEDEITQVEALSSVLSTEQIADYFEISRATFYEIMKRQPEVSRRYKRGRAKGIGVVANNLLSKARNGNTTAQIFYLKTQAGWKETSVSELVDRTPPEKKMTTEELAAELQNELDKVGKKLVDI